MSQSVLQQYGGSYLWKAYKKLDSILGEAFKIMTPRASGRAAKARKAVVASYVKTLKETMMMNFFKILCTFTLKLTNLDKVLQVKVAWMKGLKLQEIEHTFSQLINLDLLSLAKLQKGWKSFGMSFDFRLSIKWQFLADVLFLLHYTPILASWDKI